jgi:histidine ammonia-lyase
VRKLDEQLSWLARLIAIEALAAAQAVDLRGPKALGAGSRLVHAFVRETVPSLEADRETGPEAERLVQRLLAGALTERLQSVLPPS